MGMIGWGMESFSIWEGAPSIVPGVGFFYTDPSMDPNGEATDYYWGDDVGNPIAFSIPAGQGVVIDTNNSGAGYKLITKGQVADAPVSLTTVALNNFTGNPFADPIDIQAIHIDDGGMGMIGWGMESFSIWEGAPSIVPGVGFFYTDPSMDPNMLATDYYWGDDVGNPVTYTIDPGKGVVIDTNNAGDGYTITIDAPYTLSTL